MAAGFPSVIGMIVPGLHWGDPDHITQRGWGLHKRYFRIGAYAPWCLLLAMFLLDNLAKTI